MAFQVYTKPTVPGWHPAAPADIVDPAAGIKTTGHQEQEYPPYEWVNWFWDNISDWMDFHNDQMTKMETTVSTDVSYVTSTAEITAYIATLPPRIDSALTLRLSGGGAGYAAGVVTFSNLKGSGSLTIEEDTVTPPTDYLESIVLTNVDLQKRVWIDSMEFVGDAANYCLSVTNVDKLTIQGTKWSNSDYFVYATRCPDIVVSSCTNDGSSGGGDQNKHVIYATTNSHVTCYNWANTTDEGVNRVLNEVYSASGGSKISHDDSIICTDPASDFQTCLGGSQIIGEHSTNSEQTDISYTLNTAAKVESINSYIQNAGGFVAAGARFRILIDPVGSPYTLTQDVKIQGMLGGGSITIESSGANVTITGGDVYIANNSARVYMYRIVSTFFQTSIDIENNNGLVEFNECRFYDTNTCTNSSNILFSDGFFTFINTINSKLTLFNCSFATFPTSINASKGSIVNYDSGTSLLGAAVGSDGSIINGVFTA